MGKKTVKGWDTFFTLDWGKQRRAARELRCPYPRRGPVRPRPLARAGAYTQAKNARTRRCKDTDTQMGSAPPWGTRLLALPSPCPEGIQGKSMLD